MALAVGDVAMHTVVSHPPGAERDAPIFILVHGLGCPTAT